MYEVLCESKRACERVASHKERGKIIQETKILSYKTFAEISGDLLIVSVI